MPGRAGREVKSEGEGRRAVAGRGAASRRDSATPCWLVNRLRSTVIQCISGK